MYQVIMDDMMTLSNLSCHLDDKIDDKKIIRLLGRRLMLFPETETIEREVRSYKVLPLDATLEELDEYGEEGVHVPEVFLFPLNKKTRHELERRRKKPPQVS